MRARVSCQGAGADTISQIVYKWPKKYTQLVRYLCCPIRTLHGQQVLLYRAGEICRFQDTTGRSGAAQFLDPALKEYGWIQGRIPPDAWMLRG